MAVSERLEEVAEPITVAVLLLDCDLVARDRVDMIMHMMGKGMKVQAAAVAVGMLLLVAVVVVVATPIQKGDMGEMLAVLLAAGMVVTNPLAVGMVATMRGDIRAPGVIQMAVPIEVQAAEAEVQR